MFLHNPLVPKTLVSFKSNQVILDTKYLKSQTVENYFLHQERNHVIHVGLFHNVSAKLDDHFQTFLETMQAQHCKPGKNF